MPCVQECSDAFVCVCVCVCACMMFCFAIPFCYGTLMHCIAHTCISRISPLDTHAFYSTYMHVTHQSIRYSCIVLRIHAYHSLVHQILMHCIAHTCMSRISPLDTHALYCTYMHITISPLDTHALCSTYMHATHQSIKYCFVVQHWQGWLHSCTYTYIHTPTYIYMWQCVLGCLKLIAFESAGEDRERRETPVLSRLEIAFFRVAQTWSDGIFPSHREFCGQLKRNQLYAACGGHCRLPIRT